MNLCRGCGQDFGSFGAFEAHRVGKHAYSFAEGFAMSPPREDGRRCLSTGELVEFGWKRNSHGRWRTPATHEGAQIYATNAPGGDETC